MSTWSFFDADGRKVAQFTGREIDAALNVPTGGEMIAGDFDENEVYWNGATLASRPTLDIPAQHTVPINTDWTLTDIPEGTEVYTDEQLLGSVGADEQVALNFSNSGIWKVKLIPSFPWLTAISEVTVT